MEPMNLTASRVPLETLNGIEQGANGIDERILALFGAACANYGKNIQALECELDGLESKNRLVVAEITQLTLTHNAELNAIVDGYFAGRKLIVEKLKGVIERLKAFPKGYHRCGFSSFDVGPFQEIVDEIGSQVVERHYTELRKYPEYSDMRLNNNRPKDKAAIVPASMTTYTVVGQSIFTKFTEEIVALEAKVMPLRVVTDELIEKKEIIIDFHRQYLEDLNRIEKLGKLKGIVNRIRASYDNIKWKVPETTGAQCSKCIDEYAACYIILSDRLRFAQITHDKMQQEVNEKLHDVQEHVLAAVKSLEALIL